MPKLKQIFKLKQTDFLLGLISTSQRTHTLPLKWTAS